MAVDVVLSINIKTRCCKARLREINYVNMIDAKVPR